MSWGVGKTINNAEFGIWVREEVESKYAEAICIYDLLKDSLKFI